MFDRFEVGALGTPYQKHNVILLYPFQKQHWITVMLKHTSVSMWRSIYQCHWQYTSVTGNKIASGWSPTMLDTMVQCSTVFFSLKPHLHNSSIFVLFDEKTFLQKAFGLSIYSNLWVSVVYGIWSLHHEKAKIKSSTVLSPILNKYFVCIFVCVMK